MEIGHSATQAPASTALSDSQRKDLSLAMWLSCGYFPGQFWLGAGIISIAPASPQTSQGLLFSSLVGLAQI